MLKYNFETMRYEIIGDKRPDLLAEKLEDFGHDDYNDCDTMDDEF